MILLTKNALYPTLPRRHQAEGYEQQHAAQLQAAEAELYQTYRDWQAKGAVPVRTGVLGRGNASVVYRAGSLAERIPWAASLVPGYVRPLVRGIGLAGAEQIVAATHLKTYSRIIPAVGREGVGAVLAGADHKTLGISLGSALDNFVAYQKRNLALDGVGDNMQLDEAGGVWVMDYAVRRQAIRVKIGQLLNLLGDGGLQELYTTTGNHQLVRQEMTRRIPAVELLRDALLDRWAAQGTYWEPSTVVVHDRLETMKQGILPTLFDLPLRDPWIPGVACKDRR